MKVMCYYFSIWVGFVLMCGAFAQQDISERTGSLTDKDQLIKELNGEWSIEETGKAYWLGYAPVMYRIAEFGEQAIVPLSDYGLTCESLHARKGVVLTLHLIGTGGKISGRLSEKFVSKAARKALLKLLTIPDIQIDILKLLIRDPWESDVPDLMRALNVGGVNTWAFVKAMQRYDIDTRPIQQRVPDNLANIPCRLESESLPFHRAHIEALILAGGKWIQSQDSLLREENLWGETKYTYGTAESKFGQVLSTLTDCTFCDFGQRIDYYVSEGVIHLCDIETAKNRWVSWFESRH